jgi:curli biogenesis system outer membrane secretion channel CsgG
MKRFFLYLIISGSVLGVVCVGCATVEKPPEPRPMTASVERQREAQQAAINAPMKIYKRKVAVGRFSNESTYGRGLLLDTDLDPLGKQASDILATMLQNSNRFLIFERPDLEKIEREQKLTGDGRLVGVDALILGSITEFGRATEGKSGFLSSTKRQVVRAVVNLRLVEVSTGRVFFAADGVGEAITETGEIAGFGSKAAYDATLNEKAITAAIGEVLDEVIGQLEARPWRTYLLDQDGDLVYVSGGYRQGLKVGDELVVMRAGKTVISKQTGLPIELPGTEVARLRVTSQFGDNEVNEGSVCTVTTGSLVGQDLNQLYVAEGKEQ